MAQLSISICRQLSRARRARGMTQSALAQAVGCKQSAVSMLESGQPGKLSQESVEKIATLLDVTLDRVHHESTHAAWQPTGSAFCPNARCPSNIPYLVDGDLLFWPQPQPDRGGTRCAACGEVLERHCPVCHAAVTPGACCQVCGTPRVTNTLPEGHDPEVWAIERRRELTAFRALIQ